MIIIEQGSSLYYSLLWIDTEARERFVRRLNLIQTLSTTLDDVQEHEVAEKKIHWWHEEIQRMCEGYARHPSTSACQLEAVELAQQHTDLLKNPFMSACLSLLSSASTARLTPPKTIAERNSQLIQLFQVKLALLSHALSSSPEDLVASTHPKQAAEALAKHEQLSRLPALIHRGHAIFSDETYKAHNVTPKDLATGIRVEKDSKESSIASGKLLSDIPVVEEKIGKATLLTSAIEDTHAALLKATISVNVSERYRNESLIPLWRLMVLRHKQLAMWQKNQPDLLLEHMALTPLAKLFYAWRNRR